jgi:hypothetical protein
VDFKQTNKHTNQFIMFSPGPPGPPVSSTTKSERHDITEALLKVALKTIKRTNKQTE